MHFPGEDNRGKGIMWGGVGWGEKVVAMICHQDIHVTCNTNMSN